ncbi:hypothetical protein CJ030_MR8G016824 [Morella rubra]|uniref:Uncharacterized protein n=1 Tax=Morella rubra TaxID=262757 RepID=A0A6A1UTW0_9ROSI|nr:hypothetical protein CJ030_MR8G016824 [Morella rubra]
MATGGKRLHCDSSARPVGAINHPGTRAAACPSNGVDDDLPSPASINPYDFNLDYDRPEGRNTVMSTMNTAYKMAKLTVAHTSDSRFFQRALALMKNSETVQNNPALMYKETHNNKDGAWTSDGAREYFENIKELQLQHESEGRSFTEVEIFTEILGTKTGYVHGFDT